MKNLGRILHSGCKGVVSVCFKILPAQSPDKETTLEQCCNKGRHYSNITDFHAFLGLHECFGLNLDVIVHQVKMPCPQICILRYIQPYI